MRVSAVSSAYRAADAADASIVRRRDAPAVRIEHAPPHDREGRAASIDAVRPLERRSMAEIVDAAVAARFIARARVVMTGMRDAPTPSATRAVTADVASEACSLASATRVVTTGVAYEACGLASARPGGERATTVARAAPRRDRAAFQASSDIVCEWARRSGLMPSSPSTPRFVSTEPANGSSSSTDDAAPRAKRARTVDAAAPEPLEPRYSSGLLDAAAALRTLREAADDAETARLAWRLAALSGPPTAPPWARRPRT